MYVWRYSNGAIKIQYILHYTICISPRMTIEYWISIFLPFRDNAASQSIFNSSYRIIVGGYALLTWAEQNWKLVKYFWYRSVLFWLFILIYSTMTTTDGAMENAVKKPVVEKQMTAGGCTKKQQRKQTHRKSFAESIQRSCR